MARPWAAAARNANMPVVCAGNRPTDCRGHLAAALASSKRHGHTRAFGQPRYCQDPTMLAPHRAWGRSTFDRRSPAGAGWCRMVPAELCRSKGQRHTMMARQRGPTSTVGPLCHVADSSESQGTNSDSISNRSLCVRRPRPNRVRDAKPRVHASTPVPHDLRRRTSTGVPGTSQDR